MSLESGLFLWFGYLYNRHHGKHESCGEEENRHSKNSYNMCRRSFLEPFNLVSCWYQATAYINYFTGCYFNPFGHTFSNRFTAQIGK